MKTKQPTPDNLTLDEIARHFHTDEAAREYLERVRWPNGPTCPHCKSKERVWKLEANEEKKIRNGLYQCADCKKQFTVTVGTIFEDSHIPLRKWLVAWYMICTSKKGVSALQMQRMLALGSYRTAWMMMHKIRHALRDPLLADDKLGGTVEADETYVGGKTKGMGRAYVGNKTPVVSLVERKGRVRSQIVPVVTSHNLKAVLKKHVHPTAHIFTDQLHGYKKAARGFASHQTVNHSAGEYSRGIVNTNTVEGFFSILKRGVMGTFHHISVKHMPLYLAEFDFRYNHRKTTDGVRTLAALVRAEGKRMTYSQHCG
jgi:transposase-like protein